MPHILGANASAPPAAWHDEPSFRGTSTILSTCLVTMILSVWTAVYVNLPEHKKGHMQKWRRLRWLVAGLIAPEIVALNAWEQKQRVAQLTRFMEELHRKRHYVPIAKPVTLRSTFCCWRRAWLGFLRSAWHRVKVIALLEPGDLQAAKSDERSELPECPWTSSHSWYAVMGGFAFDIGNSSILPAGRERVVLTPKGLSQLATHWPHLIPSISEKDIEDKSKSDSLGKLITCWQAAYFAIQCVVRLASGLDATLLELNVFGHAICALIIYAIWWKKSKDVDEPTTLEGDESRSIAALFCTLSSLGSKHLPRSGFEEHFEALQARLHWTPRTPVPGYNYRWVPTSLPVASVQASELMDPGRIRIGNSFWSLDPVDKVYDPPKLRHHSVLIDKYTVARLEAIRDRDKLEEWLADRQHEIDLVRDRSRNWGLTVDQSNPSTQSGNDVLLLICGGFIAAMLYGGLHAVAWNALFSTWLQQLLWRMSCVTVALEAPVVALLLLPGAGTITLWRRYASKDALRAWRSKHPRLGLLTGVTLLLLASPVYLCVSACVLFMPIARFYLVVESFIGMAYLSENMLRTPSWTLRVPHIT